MIILGRLSSRLAESRVHFAAPDDRIRIDALY